ncbi:MAG: TonB-dependent receptor [Alphaproteobacteria bacterium]|nr:TonB-dependent receptor [Alphaproteobacteria bacterium]
MPTAAPPPPPPTEVQAVVVYPPRLAPLGGEAAFSAVQVGQQVLKVTPRLDDALESVPGVSLFRRASSLGANPTTQGLSLRAIAPSGAGRALVTLDGVPQNDPFGGWVIWTALPPEGLEGATVVRGAGAGPYGAGALTGTVALQERGASGGLAALDASAGDEATYRLAAAGGAPGLLVVGQVESSGGYDPVRGPSRGAADQPLTLDAESGSFRVQHDFDGIQVAARVAGYGERRGAGLAGARSIASGGQGSLTFGRTPSEGVGGWRVQLWIQDSDLQNSSVAVAAHRTATTPANDEYSTPAQGYGLNAALQGMARGVSWELGLDGRLYHGFDYERFRYIGGSFTRGRQAGGEAGVGGAYFEAAYDHGPWIVTGGVRLDEWFQRDAVRREWDLFTGQTTLDQPSPDSSGTVPTGRFGIRYELSRGLYVRAAAYAGFRPPTLNELYRPFRVGNDVTEANAALKPEKLQGVEAGFGGDRWFHWSGTVFYNWLKDPVTNVTLGVGPGVFPIGGFIPAGGTLRQRRNAGEIDAYGFEGEASGDVGETLSWRAAVAATHARVDGGTAAPQLTGLRPAQTPELTVTSALDWRPLEPLDLTAEARYEGGRWDDDLNTRKLHPGTELNIRAAWRLAPHSDVYVAVDNVVNANLDTQTAGDGTMSYAEPRMIRVGFSYRR